jgi:hypothetical protein
MTTIEPEGNTKHYYNNEISGLEQELRFLVGVNQKLQQSKKIINDKNVSFNEILEQKKFQVLKLTAELARLKRETNEKKNVRINYNKTILYLYFYNTIYKLLG